ncbi:MAG: hypothetical protein NT023_22580 [Armatimonadetes bacterium]|nr:hypothetical protein [Armatimonadota bacterium]
MGTAYTPGLRVSAHTTIEKVRRLPLKGDVLVKVGDKVSPRTVVARTEIPGIMQTVKLAEKLGVEPADVQKLLKVKAGDAITQNDLLAETKGLFGRYFRSEIRCPVTGTIELVSQTTGHVGIRQAATPIEKDAYVEGVVTRVMPGEGVVVTCEGALVQGIFGVGGERQAELVTVTNSPADALTEAHISPEHKGKIIVGGSNISSSALRKAQKCGVVGIVVGGIIDRDLMDYLAEVLNEPGYDIGVAITGHEPIPFTLIVTEGFGTISMAERTFQLLKSLQGQVASINGATQIRAGVIRPEVIVPLKNAAALQVSSAESGLLDKGTPIRVIREPYFGILGTVTGLPSELTQVESETWVRVLNAKLADGRDVTVPRANVEIIETV